MYWGDVGSCRYISDNNDEHAVNKEKCDAKPPQPPSLQLAEQENNTKDAFTYQPKYSGPISLTPVDAVLLAANESAAAVLANRQNDSDDVLLRGLKGSFPMGMPPLMLDSAPSLAGCQSTPCQHGPLVISRLRGTPTGHKYTRRRGGSSKVVATTVTAILHRISLQPRACLPLVLLYSTLICGSFFHFSSAIDAAAIDSNTDLYSSASAPPNSQLSTTAPSPDPSVYKVGIEGNLDDTLWNLDIPPPTSTFTRHYTNKWAVRIEGGQEEADHLAHKYGYTNLGPVIPGDEYYLFESPAGRRRSNRKTRTLQSAYISREDSVLWLEQQVAKRRVKRDFLPERRYTRHRRSTTLEMDPLLQLPSPPLAQMSTRGVSGGGENYYGSSAYADSSSSSGRGGGVGVSLHPLHRTHSQQPHVHYQPQHQSPQFEYHKSGGGFAPIFHDADYEQDPAGLIGANRVGSGRKGGGGQRRPFPVPNDPFWRDMWYLHRSHESEGEMDHNVKEAWDLGFTGRGVVVTILDDGLERTHPDISPNYDPLASYDVNDRDDDPTPRYEYTDENRHGTRCAGEVASVFNNSLCIVGIAFNARIGGIRMLDGDVTDAVEATSLSHNFQHIDIYSASWGPDDDGRTVDGPATLTRSAFERGIREGRQGKGSIFIWASGNGGKDKDSCNCDGYTNSIHTLSISSATERGNIPWYSEACSSTLATAYSSGQSGEKMIVTTDLHHSCTKSHTGTSASAPLAAGIAALTLEANPDLGWRDLQHIVVRTAKPVNLRAGDWKINAVGRNVSHSFGYGLLDAGAMVRLAQLWKSVPRQKRCRSTYPTPYKLIPRGSRLHLELYTDGCAGWRESNVRYLEHVQAIITLNAPKRGDIQIYLTSPRNTRSTLLAKRVRDTSRTGFRDWAFMTTHSWGETSHGTWRLEIENDGWDDAELLKWELVLYGTDIPVGAMGPEPSISSLSARSINSYHGDEPSTGTRRGDSPALALLFLSLIPLLLPSWFLPQHFHCAE